MDDPEPPGPKYGFSYYRKKVIELVGYIDTTFSVDPGRIGEILDKPSKYFSTLRTLKKYMRAYVPIGAKVDNKNLPISKHSQLKNLRECLNFRLTALNSKILPLEFR